jgi:hypothetical protein
LSELISRKDAKPQRWLDGIDLKAILNHLTYRWQKGYIEIALIYNGLNPLRLCVLARDLKINHWHAN